MEWWWNKIWWWLLWSMMIFIIVKISDNHRNRQLNDCPILILLPSLLASPSKFTQASVSQVRHNATMAASDFFQGVHTETRRRGTIKWIQGTHKHYVNKCLDWPPNQQSDMRFHKEVTLPTTRSFVPVFVLIHHPPQPFMMWTVWFLIPNLYIRPLLLVHHLQSSQFSLPDWSLQATTADRARILGHPISHPWCLFSIRSPKSRSFFFGGGGCQE